MIAMILSKDLCCCSSTFVFCRYLLLFLHSENSIVVPFVLQYVLYCVVCRGMSQWFALTNYGGIGVVALLAPAGFGRCLFPT